MSAQQQPIQKRHSSKKKIESSMNISNKFDYGHISKQSNENENSETFEKTPSIHSVHSLGKDGLEDFVLAKLKTLSSHFPDNPDIPNLVSMIKKGRRKERLNKLENLAKERRKKQKQQQQSPVPHYMEHMNDDDLLIKSQERLRNKHNAHGIRRNKSVKIQDYQESDGDEGNQERPVQMDVNQKDFDSNRQSQSQPSLKNLTPQTIIPPPPNIASRVDSNTGIRNLERLRENKGQKSKKYDSRDVKSYMNYKAKLQEKARRRQEFELIRKHVIKEETNRRLRQLEEFRRKQRKEKMAQLAQQDARNQELNLNDDIIDDEYKEIRKQRRRERMAEIARESRDPSINGSQEQDYENIEYWENLTPDNIGWKEFLSISKGSGKNDKSQFSCWTLYTEQSDKYQDNISKALAPEQSFKQILKERYILQPVIGKSEKLQQIGEKGESHRKENESEPIKFVNQAPKKAKLPLDKKKNLQKDSKSAPQRTQQSFNKFSFNQPKLRQKLQEEIPISKPPLKPTHLSHLEEGSNDIPPSIAKVQGWLKHFEEFDEPEKIENNSKIPSNYAEGYSSSEDFSIDNETSTMGNSESLLALLSKIRSTKKKINSRDKVSLERHQKTLEVMQRIVTDLIETHEEIVEREKKMEDGKKHVRELLNTITGKNTRDIIDALSQSLDQPPHDIDATSDSLDTLLKQLRKATEGLKNVEGQLTRKEKRLQTALEVAQDLVDKRLNLINWERRLRAHEQCVNDIASRIGESKDSSMINQQNDGSGYVGSVLGSFLGKKDHQGQEQVDDAIKPSVKGVYTEEDWEKILIPENEPVSSKASSVDDNEKFDNKVGNAGINQEKQYKDECLNEAQDTESYTTIQSSSEINQISQMDEYLLLLKRHESMKEYLDKIGDNQQSIKDYLSKTANNNNGNNSSVINSEYFRPNMSVEEVRTEIKDDVPAEKLFDKQIDNFTPTLPTFPTFNHLTNENLLETELNVEDSDSDSDWEKLTSRFNGLSTSRNNIVKQKSTNRVSKRTVKTATVPTSLNKFPNISPTTESLVRNANWEELLSRVQSKSHLQETPSWVKMDDQGNKLNTSSSNFFVNTEGKLGRIFANMSQTSTPETVKGFNHGEIPKVQVFNAENNMGSLNQRDVLTSEKSSSLNLGDYVSRSFVIPQQISERIQREGICEKMNSTMPQKELEIPKYNFEETQKHQEEKKEINSKDDTISSDNNDDGIMRSSIIESGLDFAEVVNNLPGWRTFVSLVKGNVDKTKD